jgi:hypothetical protein
MNLNGPAQTVTNGTHPVPLGAIVRLAAIKTVAMHSLVHLIIWVNQEQRVRE